MHTGTIVCDTATCAVHVIIDAVLITQLPATIGERWDKFPTRRGSYLRVSNNYVPPGRGCFESSVRCLWLQSISDAASTREFQESPVLLEVRRTISRVDRALALLSANTFFMNFRGDPCARGSQLDNEIGNFIIGSLCFVCPSSWKYGSISARRFNA